MREFITNHRLLVIGVAFALVVAIGVIAFLVSLPQSPSTNTNNSASGPTPTPTTSGGATATVKTSAAPTASGAASGNIIWWGAFLSEADVAPLIAKYTAANPGVKITYLNNATKQSDLVNYRKKLTDAYANPSISANPDVMLLDSGWFGATLPNLEAAPSDKLSYSDFSTNFYDFVTADLTRKSKVYGVPMWVDNLAVIYNKKLWTAEGLTSPSLDWSKMTSEQLSKLTKRDTNGTVTTGGISGGVIKNSEFWFEITNMLMLQNGVKITNDGSASTTATPTTGTLAATFASNPDSKDSVSFYKNFAGSGKYWNSNFNEDIAAFLEKKLATYIAPSWRLNDVLRYNTVAGLGIEVGISEVPQLRSTSNEKSNFATYWANAVNKNSTKKTAAWDFLVFLGQAENIELLNTTMKTNKSTVTGIIYPRKDMKSKQLADQYLSEYVKALDYTKTWYMVDETAVRSAFSQFYDSNAGVETVQSEVNNTLSKFKEP